MYWRDTWQYGRRTIVMIGKDSLVHALFSPHSTTKEWALGLQHFFNQGIRSPHSLCWTRHLVWEYLSLFQTQHVLLCSASLRHTAPGQLHCYICPLWGGDRILLLQHKRNMCRLIALHWLPGTAHWLLGIDAHYRSKLCLFSVWVLDCVVFSLATQILRCNGHKCSAFSSCW